jgi:hypothetical protein
MPYVNVYVDESEILEELSDSDLIKEMEKRNVSTEAFTEDTAALLNKIFYAFYFGKEQEAISSMREYVQDVTGRTLP